jgi:hypothetical protein
MREFKVTLTKYIKNKIKNNYTIKEENSSKWPTECWLPEL